MMIEIREREIIGLAKSKVNYWAGWIAFLIYRHVASQPSSDPDSFDTLKPSRYLAQFSFFSGVNGLVSGVLSMGRFIFTLCLFYDTSCD